LRHIERSGILVHLVEPQPADGSDPVANYHAIRRELVQYDPRLASRAEIVCVSKCELPGAEELRAALQRDLGREVLAISAVTGRGLDQLLSRIGRELQEQRTQAPAPAVQAEAVAQIVATG
jgi:GTP-binding protein